MKWTDELNNNIATAEELRGLIGLDDDEYLRIRNYIKTFPMSVPRYYFSLIDKNDPNDPIRKMALPSIYNIEQTGELDTSGEHSNTVMSGVQHKYKQTLLILCTSKCAMYCRYCFRKRLVGVPGDETSNDPELVVKYISDHSEVSNCLLSGGDFLMLDNESIESWLKPLTAIDQLDFVRMGSRIPVTFPDRIINDPKLLDILKRYNNNKQLYLITHFNHPNEITSESKEAIRMLQKSGLIIKNQTVLLKGVNDVPDILAELLKKLTSIGVIPHYIFQCRPVKGVKADFQVPLISGREIVTRALSQQNGLGKAAEYTMSHITGKINIVGRDEDGDMIFKYVQAKDPSMIGKIFKKRLDQGAAWLDDDLKL